jgi:hypothetical protein
MAQQQEDAQDEAKKVEECGELRPSRCSVALVEYFETSRLFASHNNSGMPAA